MPKKITCHNIDGEKIEVEPEKLIFRPSVYGVLIKDDKVLLSRQWDGYDFPGGGVEIHESMDEALRREVYEETGLEVRVKGIFHAESSYYYSNHSKARPPRYYNCQLLYFLIEQVGGELSIENIDDSEQEYIGMPEWVKLSDLDKIKFYNSVDSPSLIRKAKKYAN